MAERIPEEEQSNYEIFRDCLSEPMLRALVAPAEKAKKKKKARKARSSVGKKEEIEAKVDEPNEKGEGSAAEDLGEFIDYLSSVIFLSLPTGLTRLSYIKFRDSVALQDRYSAPISASVSTSLINTIPPMAIDSLESYGLLPTQSDATDQYNFFTPVFSSYASAATAPPPVWTSTRTTECELCQRSWIPLMYHHLIPKSTHDRVLKRGWHDEDVLNSVAWLCRACHSFVHRMVSNEELAKGYYTMELVRSGGMDGENRDEVEGWCKWVEGVRWKSR
ncbi:hypothetical protein K458DRAFT_486537 [Lentithecium fluviatile CBS 122367]|uniref:HNH domain-containing protein n=1 Tax=Lentithecium fluviatile CBS 122367 TaxID=1168545 RepID=A0A6G1J581_9PLEO|nr:hypothetical protein K458DRAFT_486537 [Lentithecium fluviatile CBS 122367]